MRHAARQGPPCGVSSVLRLLHLMPVTRLASNPFVSLIAIWGLLLATPPAAAASHFTDCVERTGSGATIVLTTDAPVVPDGSRMEVGDEVAVFTPEGICAGVAIWSGENLALTAWSDNPMTEDKDGFANGDSITFTVWDADLQEAYQATEATFDPDFATGPFRDNDIFVLSELAVGSTTGMEAEPGLAFRLDGNRPNPFKHRTDVAISLPQESAVSLEVFNTLGKRVLHHDAGTLAPGSHLLPVDANGWASGAYLYRVTAGERVATSRMMLVR